MIPPPIPENEEERLSALRAYNIMDSLPESDYDNLTKIASEICQVPVALITFMGRERQWFKSKVGVDLSENQRNLTFCAHGMIDTDEPLVVNDATKDARFVDNPLVTGPFQVRFYAGVQLVDKAGLALGSICVLDVKKNELTQSQLETLKILAQQIMRLLELRKTITDLEISKQQLTRSNKHLKEYDYIISHDLKAPLRNMKHLAEAVNEIYENKLDETGKKYLQLIDETATDAISYVTGILNYSQAMHFIDIQKEKETIDFSDFLKGLLRQQKIPNHLKILIPDQLPLIQGSKAIFRQIFSNLINNAIKYHDKEEGWIKINYTEDEKHHQFQISDNGRGIPEDKIGSIFTLFYMVDKTDAKDNKSSGIGLSIVKNLITEMEGTIAVKSTLGVGTTFDFTFPK